MPNRVTCLVAALLATALSAAWVADGVALEEFRSTETKTFVVGAQPDVLIEAINGDVSYVAIEGTTATITIETSVRAESKDEADRIRDGVEVLVDGGDGFFTARVDHPAGFERWLRRLFGSERSISVSFLVRGPKGADGTLRSVSGDVEVEGVSGQLELRSVSGDVTARRLGDRVQTNSVSGGIDIVDCAGPVKSRTVSGDQRIEGCDNRLEAHSVSGNIWARFIKGGADVETTSGDVTLEHMGATVSVETTSGEVRVDQRAGGFDLHSTSGDITVRSPATEVPLIARSTSGQIEVSVNPAAIGDVTLETSSGDIKADLEMKVRRHTRHHLAGQVGAGRHELRISTVSGDIVLREL